MTQTVETARDRKALAHDAGMRSISGVSVLAGTLVAWGAVLVILAIAGSVAAAVHVNTNFGSYHFHSVAISGAITLALVVLVSYLFGGYVAGRMARRAGAVNGLIVFVLGLVIVAAVSGAVTGLAGTHGVVRGLRNVGLPTTWSRWRDVAGLGGVVAVVAMVVGSMAGGILGERWHTKLLARALDPAIGPEVRTRPARTDDEVDVRDGVGGAADGDRLAAAQRDEADRVAAEGTAEIRGDRSNTRHHHFIRR